MKSKSEAKFLIGKLIGYAGLAGFLTVLILPGLDFGVSLGVSFENGKYLSYGQLTEWWFSGPTCAALCLIAVWLLRGTTAVSADLMLGPRRLILKRVGSVVLDSALVISLLTPVAAYLVVSIDLNDYSLRPKEFVRTVPSLVDIASLASLVGILVFLGVVFFCRGERGMRTPGLVIMGLQKEFPSGARDVVDAKRGFQFMLTYVLFVIVIPYYLIKAKTIFMYDGTGVYRETNSQKANGAAG
jgi:hypothetical protein